MDDVTELTLSAYESFALESLAAPRWRGLRSLVKATARPADGWPHEFPTLDPLAGLEALETLDLFFETSVGDLGAVARLPALRVLRLGGVTGSLAPLAHCPSLRVLALEANALRDLSPLKALAAQLDDVTLASEGLADLSGLGAFTRLRSLALVGCPATVLPLDGLASLRALKAFHLHDLRELPGLETLHALEALFLDYTPALASLDALSALPQLRSLSLFGFARLTGADLERIGRLTALRALTLWDTPTKSLAPLEGLAKLEELNVFGCPIAHARLREAIPRLPALRRLWCTVSDGKEERLRKDFPRLGVNNRPPLE